MVAKFATDSKAFDRLPEFGMVRCLVRSGLFHKPAAFLAVRAAWQRFRDNWRPWSLRAHR